MWGKSATTIMTGEGGEKFKLLDVTPLSYGLEIVSDANVCVDSKTHKYSREKTDFFQLILINNLVCYEGERASTKDNNLLGKLELTKIPLTPRGVPHKSYPNTISSNKEAAMVGRGRGADVDG